VPEREVKDIPVFKKPKKNQKFLFSYDSPCTGGGENLDLIVLAEPEPHRKSYKVLKARRANTERERFEEASTAAIACEAAE
jgi:hypothetical protein